MSDTLIFIYLIFFVMIFASTFAFMWKMMGSTLNDFNKPKRNVHPEMTDVKTGDELLVFKGEDEDDDEGDVVIIRK